MAFLFFMINAWLEGITIKSFSILLYLGACAIGTFV